MPVAALLGAILLVWADVLARVLLAPQEIPIGIITALLGAPFLLVLIRRLHATGAERPMSRGAPMKATRLAVTTATTVLALLVAPAAVPPTSRQQPPRDTRSPSPTAAWR